MTEDEMREYYLRSSTETPNILVFQNNGQPIFTIKPDGRVEIGPGYTPDDGARAFWDLIYKLKPKCPHCGK